MYSGYWDDYHSEQKPLPAGYIDIAAECLAKREARQKSRNKAIKKLKKDNPGMSNSQAAAIWRNRLK